MTTSLSRRALLAAVALVASLATAAAVSAAGSSADLELSQGKGAVSTRGASWH